MKVKSSGCLLLLVVNVVMILAALCHAFGLCLTCPLGNSQVRPISKSKLMGIVVAELFTGQKPFMSPNQQRQSSEGCSMCDIIYIYYEIVLGIRTTNKRMTSSVEVPSTKLITSEVVKYVELLM